MGAAGGTICSRFGHLGVCARSDDSEGFGLGGEWENRICAMRVDMVGGFVLGGKSLFFF